MAKMISTQLTPKNIASVLRLLADAPARFLAHCQRLHPDSLRQPLKPNERSFADIVAHVVHCDDRTNECIYNALILREPLILDIHPERQWGKLVRYQQQDLTDLFGYWSFRRRVLLGVLTELSDADWARTVRENQKQRQESVYWLARVQALHESEHLTEIESVDYPKEG